MKFKTGHIALSSILLFGGIETMALDTAHAAQENSKSMITVSDEEGVVVKNATVTILSGETPVASSTTDESGQAMFNNLQNDKTYHVEVNGARISNAYFRQGDNLYISVLREEVNQAKSAGATFTAHVINKSMQNVADQKVELYDITEGKVFYKAMTTDANGNVMFEGLPAARNFAVYVNGVNQGYTVRGVEGSKLENTFFVDAQGEGHYDAATAPATVFVVDENDNPLAGQTIALYHGDVKVGEAMTLENGKLVFGDNLTAGTHYDIYLNGEKLPNKFVKSGDTVYVYSTPIVEEKPEADVSEQKEVVHENKQESTPKEEVKENDKVIIPKDEVNENDNKPNQNEEVNEKNKDVTPKEERHIKDDMSKLNVGSNKEVAGMKTHVVKQGETISDISVKHHSSVKQIMKDNNLSTQAVKPGDKIIVKDTAMQQKSEMKNLPLTGESKGLFAGFAGIILVVGAALVKLGRKN
ncbi:LysM domain protein [Macrococcoides canis]|uniref:LysM domain protein n=1 Tax=Macrococcoides canis TaxID=1855823 RepID=A0A1W7ADU9_9STAP|nr:LysM peptidoglycan-binding domain-containing protein [Macrococcus canis]ARQ07741.1 LysM domain protein [Macrococcus canis]